MIYAFTVFSDCSVGSSFAAGLLCTDVITISLNGTYRFYVISASPGIAAFEAVLPIVHKLLFSSFLLCFANFEHSVVSVAGQLMDIQLSLSFFKCDDPSGFTCIVRSQRIIQTP